MAEPSRLRFQVKDVGLNVKKAEDPDRRSDGVQWESESGRRSYFRDDVPGMTTVVPLTPLNPLCSFPHSLYKSLSLSLSPSLNLRPFITQNVSNHRLSSSSLCASRDKNRTILAFSKWAVTHVPPPQHAWVYNVEEYSAVGEQDNKS